MLIDRIDEVRMFIFSIIGASTGTALNYTTEMRMLDASADPTWFCDVSPILQTVAWCVAIIAGIATTVKIIASFRRKPKTDESKKED